MEGTPNRSRLKRQQHGRERLRGHLEVSGTPIKKIRLWDSKGSERAIGADR